ncbi:unnamed protein product [Caenorhabditis brenneri]
MNNFLIPFFVAFSLIIQFSGSLSEGNENSGIVCPPNEEWAICGSCEGECGLPDPPCFRNCKPSRCECRLRDGFRRNREGECVVCDGGAPAKEGNNMYYWLLETRAARNNRNFFPVPTY